MNTNKKVLLVDDDIDVLAVVETILENEGYLVITACNKEEGIKKAKSEKPDIAILDVMMSTHYEGFELAELFTREAEYQNMIVLMQTSVEVFESNDDDVMKSARYYREKMSGKELDVLLIQDFESKKAGIDYRDSEGMTHWLSVDGFIRKPVSAKSLITSIEQVIGHDEKVLQVNR